MKEVESLFRNDFGRRLVCTRLIMHPGEELPQEDLISKIKKACQEIGFDKVYFREERCMHHAGVIKEALGGEILGYMLAYSKSRGELHKNTNTGKIYTTKSFALNPDPLVLGKKTWSRLYQALERNDLEPERYSPRSTRFYTEREVDVATAVRSGKIQPRYP